MNVPAAAEMSAVPLNPLVGVNVAVYTVFATIPPPAGVTAKPDSVPFVAVTSDAVKVVLASDSVNVMTARPVPLLETVGTLEVITTVGATVSTVMVSGVDAVLLLPAVSVKTPAGTLTVPLVVELAAGVKTTVYTVWETATKPDKVPPATAMSPIAKVVEGSDSVIVTVDV